MILAQLGAIGCAIFFLGLSILVHEFGHYLAARRMGFTIPIFSIGFGPRLFFWQRHGTEFRIAVLPIGGYVFLPQMDPNHHNTIWWRRCHVSAMGPAANLFLALVLSICLWAMGQPTPIGELNRTVGAVAPALAELWKEQDGDELREGDRILAVDGISLLRLSDVGRLVPFGKKLDGMGRPVAMLRVERDGQVEDRALSVLHSRPADGIGRPLRSLPIFPAQPTVVAEVFANSPAERAGIRVHDEVVACSGTFVHSPLQLRQILQRCSDGQPIAMTLLRDGVVQNIFLQPIAKVVAPQGSNPAIGLKLANVVVWEHPNPLRAIGNCANEALLVLRALCSPGSDVGVHNLMGVVGMAQTLHRLSLTNFRGLLHFSMAINVGLALLNLLPIPALDGGHIVLAIVERLWGRPLPHRPIAWLHSLTMTLLFALIAFVTFLDVRRWHRSAPCNLAPVDQSSVHAAETE
ncbi:MAG: RIP metalloprotease RseP [Puniceicoccales bacterium]|nr:RIP metalloprotease RseP [Puniceicoccales bacterium]